jgi:hypothetical protein
VSHDAHVPASDTPVLPVSAGVAAGVKFLIIGGLVLAIIQGAFVEMSSDFGHVWPAADSAKISLPPATLP